MRLFEVIRALGRSQTGAALAMALVILVLVTVLGITLITLGMTEVNISTNWRAYSDALYAADAGIESGVVAVRNLLSTTPNLAQQTLAQQQAALAAIAVPPTFTSTALKNVAFFTSPNSIYTIALANNNNPPSYPTTFSTGPFSGLSGIATDYLITSRAIGASGTQTTLTQTVQYVQVPLFQFNCFYGKGVDLEIEPGPAMTLNGNCFANSNIYIGADNSLTVQGVLKTAGKIFRTVKSSVTTFSSTLDPVTGTYDPTSYTYANGSPVDPNIRNASGTLKALNFDAFYQPGGSTKWSTPDSTAWANQANSTFGGTVADGAMGVTPIVPPIPALLANPNASNPDQVAHQLIELPQGSDSPQLAAAKLYSQAGFRVVDGVVTNQSGGSASLPGGTITTVAFYDPRENKCVVTVQVDIGKFNPAKPANGVLYVGSSSATPTTVCSSAMPGVPTMYGVRLVNGSDLANSGLTVVSPNPVYIAGDYNTKTYGTFKDPVTGNNTHPPAAVIGDAVTVLSNSWANSLDPTKCGGCTSYDTLGNQPTNSRPATTTSVNAALMTGPSNESTTGNGNGQLENDIRFLENWSDPTTCPGGKCNFNYSGSIVSLWHSMQATTPWRCCGSGGSAPNQQYYSPPLRNWSYDTLFNASPPPGTPQGVIITRGQWTQG